MKFFRELRTLLERAITEDKEKGLIELKSCTHGSILGLLSPISIDCSLHQTLTEESAVSILELLSITLLLSIETNQKLQKLIDSTNPQKVKEIEDEEPTTNSDNADSRDPTPSS